MVVWRADDEPLKTFCKLTQHAERTWKNVWEKSYDAYSLSIRLQTPIKQISICFFTTTSTSKEMLLQSASWKRHCATHWREQRVMDSYRQRQISISDCEISGNCVKKTIDWLIGAGNRFKSQWLLQLQRTYYFMLSIAICNIYFSSHISLYWCKLIL